MPDEHAIDLVGYPGGRDVAGNWVNDQFQLDNFGEILLLLAAAAARDCLDVEHWRAAEITVDAISARWLEPDAGIWELQPRHWTHSRLTCVAGLRAIAKVAPAAQGSSWSGLADSIMAEPPRTVCTPPVGGHARPTTTASMPACCSPPSAAQCRQATHAAWPRSTPFATTWAARGTCTDSARTPEHLTKAEGAFLLSGFHMAMAVHQQGRHTEAMRWFERNRAACGSPGLFTEEYDIEQRQLRGNYPQAFVHALLIESAKRLAEPTTEPMT